MPKVITFSELGGPEVLNLVDESSQQPQAGEVRVSMHATGLNRAEWLFIQGQYMVQPKLPSRVGMEGSGVIEAVGSNVTDWQVGDAVCVTPNFDAVQYGVCGETAVVPAEALVNKPDNLSFEAGAAVWMAYPTAYGGLVYRGGLIKGADQAVVISAASSSVGLAAMQTAKDHGATVIATTRTDAKKEPLMAAGADHVIVTQQENLVERVQEITAGKGFDIAFDPVAGSFLSELAEAAKPEARIVEYGVLSMARTDFPLFPAIGKGFQVSGFHVVYHLFQHAQRFAQAKAYILDGLQRGVLQPVIHQTFRLTQVVEAYNHMAQNQQFGKIVIKIV